MSTSGEIRAQLQELLPRERDLIYRAENALATGGYRALRDLADELVGVAARQAELRQALSEVKAQEDERDKPARPSSGEVADSIAATWRLLR